MANSFTGEPGSMPYDDREGPRPDTTCPDCGHRFYKPRQDHGNRCDACADAAWIAEKDRRQRRLAARLEAEVLALQAASFEREQEK